MKRLYPIMLVFLLIGMVFMNADIFAAGTYNYGEALQKAIYFYECQQSGPIQPWNRAKQWRGDCELNDAVVGGWLDAGDNAKFGLPMAYSAAMLGWSIYEYGSAITAAGQMTYLQNNLKWALDYLVKCDQGTSLVYQVGNNSADHNWWGPVEVIEKVMTRPSYTCNATCVTGETAAALAIGYKIFNDSNYLTHAKSLFALADATRSDATYTAAAGLYDSSMFWDELCWAATWLYIATNDSTYLTKAKSYTANFYKEPDGSLSWKWTQCWDTVIFGSLFLLDRITGDPSYDTCLRQNLNWWTVGDSQGSKITYTPGGLATLSSWGSLRYASNEAFLAFLYSDYTTDPTLKTRYQNFAISQINYILGSNPNNMSYMVGFGTNYPQHPHHRTSQGSWCDDKTVPPNPRHILYGAMVGGPNSSDGFDDVVGEYQYTEPACDYNAALVGNLAKMYSLYGGTPLSNFPPTETVGTEFYVQAKINNAGPNYTEIDSYCYNTSGWPARVVKNLNFNYYMDLTELFNAGYKVSDLTVTTNYVEFPITISPITQYSGNIYYLKVSFVDGTNIYPGGQSQMAGEVQFRIAAPPGTTFWNPANDYSYQGLTNTVATTNYITVYDGTTLLAGKEPGGGTPPPTTPTPVRTATPVVTATPTPARTATPVVTATPTPVRTATTGVTPTPTPVVTATPNTSPGGIKVQMYNSGTAASNNTISPQFRLFNTGTSAIALSGVKIRYYYTIDGVKPQNFFCDWSSIGNSNVTGTFVSMTTPKTNADYYLEIGFTSGAGSLAAGASADIQIRFVKTDWSNYTQTNDYSFNATSTTFADWTKAPGYISGALKWGTEP